MKEYVTAVRLPSHDETIAPVTILNAQGQVLRVLSAVEFRQAQPTSVDPRPFRAARHRGSRAMR